MEINNKIYVLLLWCCQMNLQNKNYIAVFLPDSSKGRPLASAGMQQRESCRASQAETLLIFLC